MVNWMTSVWEFRCTRTYYQMEKTLSTYLTQKVSGGRLLRPASQMPPCRDWLLLVTVGTNCCTFYLLVKGVTESEVLGLQTYFDEVSQVWGRDGSQIHECLVLSDKLADDQKCSAVYSSSCAIAQ